MKNKKYVSWIVLVLVCAIIVLVIKQKADEASEQVGINNVSLVNSENAQNVEDLITVSGIVTSFANGWIEIKNGDATNGFPLPEDVIVSFASGSYGIKKDIIDIRKDQKVSIEINKKNSEIVSIKILE